jgi:hypothetical protein
MWMLLELRLCSSYPFRFQGINAFMICVLEHHWQMQWMPHFSGCRVILTGGGFREGAAPPDFYLFLGECRSLCMRLASLRDHVCRYFL